MPRRPSAAGSSPTSSARASPRPASSCSSCWRPRAASSSCARCAAACGRRRRTRPRSSTTLVARGLVSRHRLVSDRRAVGGHACTAAGREIVDRLLPRAHASGVRADEARFAARSTRTRSRGLSSTQICRKTSLPDRRDSGLATNGCGPMSTRAPRPGRSQRVVSRPRAGDPRALARARRLRRVGAPARRAPSRGSSTRARRPRTAARARTTSSRASFKDIFPRFQTMRGYHVERKGGWDCHGLPVEIAVEQQLGSRPEGRDRGATGSPSSTQKCRESVFTYLEDWDRLTERIGVLGRPRRRLPHARHHATSSRSGGRCGRSGTRTCSTRATRSSRTARAAARRCPATRSRWATRTSSTRRVYVRFPVHRGGRAAAGGRRAARLDDDAVDARLQRRRRRRRRADVRPRPGGRRRRGARPRRGARRARARRGRRDPRPLPRRRARGRALRAAVRLHRRARTYGERGHTVLLGDFVTADDGTGLVHTAIAFGEDDFRLGEQYGLAGRQPGPARRHLRRAHRPVRRALRQGRRRGPRRGPARARPAAARRGLRARLPALLALRHAAALLRQAVLVHRDARRSATACSPPTRRSTGTRRTSRTGASATGCENNVDWALVARALLGHAAAGLALRAQEHALCIGSFDELEELSGVRLEDPAPPVRRRRRLPVPAVRRADAPRARGHRRLVRLGLHAVRAVARAVRERGALRAPLPRRLHLRGARPDARLVLLAARRLDAALRHVALPERRLPRASSATTRARR